MIDSKRALLIGISDYHDDSIENLQKVSDDISILTSAFSSKEISNFDEVDRIIEPQQTKLAEIKLAIEKFFSNSEKNQLSLIYIAAHATLFQNQLKVLPYDYDHEQPLSTSLPISFISSCIQNCKSEYIAVILDCCYANAGQWEFFSNKRMPLELKDQEHLNLCVIASTKRKDIAVDGGFAPFFVEALQQIEPLKREKAVNINRVFNYVKEKVETQLHQIPIKWELGSNPLPIGRMYSGFNVSRENIKSLYSKIRNKKLLDFTDGNDSKLDFIDENITEFGFQLRTGLRIIEGKPNCKLGNSAKNDLEIAIKEFQIDKGLIIVADSTNLNTFNNNKIRVVSLTDFKRNLDPFVVYLEKVVKDYEKSDIHKLECYIPLKGKNESREDLFILDDYILSWVGGGGEINQTTVLGDFGAGKTTTARHMQWILAKRYLENPISEKIPIFVNLREYGRAFDMRTLIQRTISDEIFQQNLTYQMVEELNEQGAIFWILDGFDEMATRVNSKVMKDNFSEILKLAKPNSRMFLTCRTHFFKDHDEVTQTLKGTDLYDQLRQESNCQLLFVEPFDTEDINKYIKIRLNDRTDEFLNSFRGNSQLQDLASRPILLDMIVITLPRMIDAKVKINLTNLYDQYTKLWLNRESWRVEMTIEQRITFCKNLAWHFFTDSIYVIHWSELPDFILLQFPEEKMNKQELEFLAYDIQTSTFLHRDDAGNYSFIHKSFLEFFTAYYILTQIKEGNNTVIEKKVLPHEILKFLGEMIKDSDALMKQMEDLSQAHRFSFRYFLKRFLKARMFPVMRRKDANDSIHRKYSRHLYKHLLLPLIVFLIFLTTLVIYDTPHQEYIFMRYFPLLLVFFFLFLFMSNFSSYIFLILRGQAGDPNLNFNAPAICHFSGQKINQNVLEKRKGQVETSQRGVAELTYKIILGLPLEDTKNKADSDLLISVE